MLVQTRPTSHALGAIPLIPASDVGGNTADLGWAACSSVHTSKLLCAGGEVIVPAEPTTVTSINVHDYIGEVKSLKSVGNALAVALGGVLAALEVDIGDEIRERVRLNDQSKGLVGVRGDQLGEH